MFSNIQKQSYLYIPIILKLIIFIYREKIYFLKTYLHTIKKKKTRSSGNVKEERKKMCANERE